jgi:hypothetical protein
MNSRESSGWFFAIVGTIADGLGIASYLGIQGNQSVRLAIALALCMVALLFAGNVLKDEITLWFSARGAFYVWSEHAKNFFTGLVAVLAAIGFSAYLLVAVIHQSHVNSNKTHPQPGSSLSSTVGPRDPRPS